MELRRSNPDAFKTLIAHLKELDSRVAKAGWFSTAKYENGTPVAYIAAIQNQGVTINHPGGTPYKIGANGMAVFVAKNSPEAARLPVTKPHTIVIPARPFMNLTIAREQANWFKLMGEGAVAIVEGKQTATSVMDGIGLKAAADIARSITLIVDPPLKASTIAARRRKMADRVTIGNLDKPLVASGIMLATVTHTVEDNRGNTLVKAGEQK